MSDSATITRDQLLTVLIYTELGGKTGDSNHFSYAELGSSTYSFGQMQFDVGTPQRVAHDAQRPVAWFRPASLAAVLALCLGASVCTAGDVGANSAQTTRPAITASFDCGKAVSASEKLICSDAQTSALDGKLQKTYKTALAAVVPYSKSDLVKEQRHWITYTRNICQDTACLQQAYIARIAVLARNETIIADESSCAVPNGSTECVNVVTYRDPSIRIRSFNQSLAQAKQAGKIIGCSRLINLPVGTVGSNNSFGGICTLQDGAQRKAVEICNDDMIGRFQMQTAIPQNMTDKNLVDFIYNCNGG